MISTKKLKIISDIQYNIGRFWLKISPWDIDQETENYFKYTLKYGESQYDIDQKTENYFKYTQ